MRTVARAGKAVASAASAAAVATAAQPTAHARAPVQAAPPVPPHRFADSEWLLADVRDGKKVLFQPYSEEEVDESINEVLAVLSGRPQHPQRGHGPSVLITEVTDEDGGTGGFNSSTGATTPTSPGSRADHVIEAAGLGATGWQQHSAASSQHAAAAAAAEGPVGHAAADDDGSQLQMLMRVTGKLLKRPGLQREVVACMMDDPEVAQLILGHSRDLDLYLNAAGISAPFALLPPSTGTAPATSNYGAASHPLFGGSGEDGEGGNGLLSKVVQAIASYIDVAGGALAFLGGWVRDRLAFFLGPKRDQQQQQRGGGGEQGSGRGGSTMMGSVMVLVLAVFCMMVVRGNLRITRVA